VTRALGAGADAYYVANSAESLGDLLRRLPRSGAVTAELAPPATAELEAGAALDWRQQLSTRSPAAVERRDER
jgi:hypothetical protein